MKRLLLGVYPALFVSLEILTGHPPGILSAELTPEAAQAYARYVVATEQRIDKQMIRPDAFLYVDEIPEPRRAETLADLKRGETIMLSLETRDAAGREISARGGLIHHWLGAVFIAGATLDQVRDLVQDYNHHQDFYQSEVVRSRLIRRDGNDFRVFYRLRKHKVLTVTLDTEHETHYTRLDPTHLHSRAHFTRIAEVQSPGQPDEHEEPVGHDSGFLWRMDSDWRFQERDGGVYVECETLSLTRDIPKGLGWLIKPFLTSVPRESLESTLGSTRSGVLARATLARRQ